MTTTTTPQPTVAILSTYPPTQCGLATFSRALQVGLEQEGVTASIARIVAAEESESNPLPQWPVVVTHSAGQSIARLAAALNSHDVVLVQHEFGIFAGADGEEILQILDAVERPVVTVLHTVLTAPTLHQRFIMQQLIAHSRALVTMTQTGRRNLIKHYDVHPDRVEVIPHGAADVSRTDPQMLTHDSSTVLTWGLLSEGKGIEWGIEALAFLKDRYPNLRYLVAGQTHPKVRLAEGERYRFGLMNRARALGIWDRVHLIDDYLDGEALARIIRTAAIVLLPYDSKDQVTSGVLTEAVVAGKPVIATRFPHALELLGSGAGVLVDQQDPVGIAAAISQLMDDPALARAMALQAHAIGEDFLWSTVSRRYAALLASAWRPKVRSPLVRAAESFSDLTSAAALSRRQAAILEATQG
jgi:glycosyltransferase involved in cell wall biosynthesis